MYKAKEKFLDRRGAHTSGTLATEGAITKTVIGENATDAASLDCSVALGTLGLEVTVTGVAANPTAGMPSCG